MSVALSGWKSSKFVDQPKVVLMTTLIKNEPKAKLPLIEGLRALAVIVVIVNHFWSEILPSGYLGVDIFFVISGYVITKVLLTNNGILQVQFYGTFFARRMVRIFPAFLVCVVIAMILVAFFVDPLSISYWTNSVTGISSSVGLSNMFLVVEQGNYFGSLADFNFFTHTWSLCVEIQFYLLFPLIFITHIKFNSTRRFAWRFLLVAGVSLVSLGLYIFSHSVNPTATYYLMPTRFWEFGAGSMACMMTPKLTKSSKKLSAYIVRIAIGVLIAIMFISLDQNVFATFVAVVATSWCLALPLPAKGVTNLLIGRVALWIGQRSYSMYLWHWVVLATARWTVGVTPISAPILVVIIMCFAVLSFELVEEPFRRWAKGEKAHCVLKRGLGITTFVAILMYLVAFPLRGALFLGNDGAEFRTTKSIFSAGCNVRKLPLSGMNSLEGCTSEKLGFKGSIFLVGDSHAKQFEDPIRSLAKRRGMRLVSTWGASCIFPPLPSSDELCKAGGDQVRAAVSAEVKAGDVVMIANASSYLLDDEPVDDGAIRSSDFVHANARKIFARDIESFAHVVNRKGGQVIIYLDGLQFPGLEVGALCAKEWFRPNIPSTCYRSKKQFLDLRMPVEKAMKELEIENVLRVWDGILWSECDGDICIASKMSDSNHYIDWYTWVVIKDSEDWILSPR